MTKSTRISKKSAAAAAETQFDMTAMVAIPEVANSDIAMLDSLFADLGDVGEAEVIELADSEFVTGDESTESDDLFAAVAEVAESPVAEISDDIEALVEDAERIAAKAAVYAEQESNDVEDAVAPRTTVEDVEDASDAVKPVKKTKEKKEKAPKVFKPTSISHKPGALLMAKLGSSARDYLAFSTADAVLDETALHAKQDAFIERMDDNDAIGDKVREKITMLLTWLQKGGSLNEVLKRTFTVLHEKGELTSGDKGNLQANLLAKPYSIGTARSQASQMFMALPELGITIKEKGRMVPNPDSTLLPMINAALGL